MSLSENIGKGISGGASEPLTGGGAIYGMWFDGVDDTVNVPIAQASLLQLDFMAAIDLTDLNGMLIGSGHNAGAFMGRWQDGATASAVSSAAGVARHYVDGVQVTNADLLFDAMSDGLAHAIRIEEASLGAWSLLKLMAYITAGSNHWCRGVLRDLRITRWADQVLLASYAGDGNVDANWVDTVGTAHGTVAGSPGLAVSRNGGVSWAVM